MEKEVILVPHGGLCNRMRTICAGYGICRKIGYKLTVVWVIGSELNSNMYNLFGLPSGINVVQIRATNKALRAIMKLRLFFYRRRADKAFIDVEMKKKFIVNDGQDKNVAYEDEFRKYDKIYFEECCEFYIESEKKIFAFNQDVMKRVGEIMADCGGNTVIGIHIRRTDNVQTIKSSPLELFLNVMDAECRADSSTCFFLATDDRKTSDFARQKYGKKIIEISDKEYTRNSKKGMEDALVELLCLSDTRRIYGSCYSSYPKMAAELGNVEFISVEGL